MGRSHLAGSGTCRTEQRKDDYNHVRPHSSLGALTPSEFADRNGAERMRRAPRPAPLLHRARWAQMSPGESTHQRMKVGAQVSFRSHTVCGILIYSSLAVIIEAGAAGVDCR